MICWNLLVAHGTRKHVVKKRSATALAPPYHVQTNTDMLNLTGGICGNSSQSAVKLNLLKIFTGRNQLISQACVTLVNTCDKINQGISQLNINESVIDQSFDQTCNQ